MRVLFMGTPDFAVPVLKTLNEHAEHEVIGVVTQPDRPKGRGQRLLMPPVKEYALQNALPVYQPERVKTEEFLATLTALAPDVIVVVAYGKILPPSILNLPKYGCINIHASLLPKYRGAAPIHYALLNGETKTGVTVMQMDVGMDTGDMLAQAEILITEDMTMGVLHDALMELGGPLLLDTLAGIERGSVKPLAQDDHLAVYATLITKDMEAIDWSLPAIAIYNKVRAFNPAPGAYAICPNGKRFKIWQAKVLPDINAAAGTILERTANGFAVACGTGGLELLEVQPESSKKMNAKVFWNGYGLKPNDKLLSKS